jgi:hypothetical protein
VPVAERWRTGEVEQEHVARGGRDGSVSIVVRLAASAPLRLLVALVALTAVTYSLGQQFTMGTAVVPKTAPDKVAAAPLEPQGDRLMAVLETDQLTPEYVSAVERITDLAQAIKGVKTVHSVTNTLVLTREKAFTPLATPAFGTRSKLPIGMSFAERSQLAATSRLGTSDLLAADGKTMTIIAALDSSISPSERQAAAEQFSRVMNSEIAAAGLPAQVHLAGDTYTALAASNGLRTDFYTLFVLACIVPAFIATIALRRRVPVAILLTAGGAALLLAAVFVANTSGVDSSPLAATHPIAQGNRVVDQNLHGTVALEIEFAGAAGDFRKPETLARVDALANWLRDEYDVHATGLSSTVRDEAGIITGVDSVPPNPDDVTSLIAQTNSFDNGALLHELVNDDYSRTRLIAYWPDRGSAALEAMSRRFDSLSLALLQDTDMYAHLSGRVPANESAPSSLATDLGIAGVASIAAAVLFGIVGAWARHRLALAAGLAASRQTDEDDEPKGSLFGRARHVIHELEQEARVYEHEHRPYRRFAARGDDEDEDDDDGEDEDADPDDDDLVDATD